MYMSMIQGSDNNDMYMHVCAELQRCKWVRDNIFSRCNRKNNFLNV